MTRSDDIIDGLVSVHMGAAPREYQDDFREALELLVKMAKCEERNEIAETEPEFRRQLH